MELKLFSILLKLVLYIGPTLKYCLFALYRLTSFLCWLSS